MAEALISKLFTSSLLSISLLFLFYYTLGFSTLSALKGICHLRFKQTIHFQFEDILVAAIATLTFIIAGCKIVGVFPQWQLIFKLSGIVATVCLLFSFRTSPLEIPRQFPLPKGKHVLTWLLLFSVYLIRAVIKARSLASAQYIPSGFNTDIFLYIRRSIVFLGDADLFQSQDQQKLLEILYNSPKLLSTFIYATFAYVSDDLGIAATIVTSLVLAAIALKYLILIKTESQGNYSIVTIALSILVVFQPVWCWLQDQFYWSNLLCIYLLIYVLEDLFTSAKISNSYLVKFAIAMIALVGFYPSQLPFFMVAVMIGIIFEAKLDRHSRNQYLLVIFLLTIAVICLFLTQYLDTSEVTKHFDLSDGIHGQQLNYIPFWSILDFIPRTGGTPKDFGTVILITASLGVGLATIKYCLKVVPANANWFKLLIALYAVYSCSYLVLPGEYRQGKFFFTYLVPLIIFCVVKTLTQVEFSQKIGFRLLVSALALYVLVSSAKKPYKVYVSSQVSTDIATVKRLNQPTSIYMGEGSIALGYYYFAYQIKNLDFQLNFRCPQLSELSSHNHHNTLVIASSCPKIAVDSKLQPQIVTTNIDGQD